MTKRLKAVIIIEIFILLGLFLRVVHTPDMLVMLALAIVFTVLAARSRSRILRLISLVFWAISAMILFTVAWFWMAIIFPAIMCIIFWKNNPRSVQGQGLGQFFQSQTQESPAEMVTKNNGNDVIDLDDVHYRQSGNTLTIKKITGNTKIIVPEDVAVVLDFAVNSGIVKIFDETPKVNAGNVRYFSENVDSASKKIRIILRVETGNVEVVRG